MENRNWRSPRSIALSVLALVSIVPSAHAAWYINPQSIPEVRRLAHVIQMNSARTAADAQSSIDWRNPAEQNALNALNGLVQASASLDREVESAWPNADQLETLLAQTVRLSEQVQYTAPTLRSYAYDQYLFRDISESVQQLRRLRGVPQQPGPIGGNPRAVAHALVDSTRDLLSRAQREAGPQPWRQNVVRELQSLTIEADRLYRDLETNNVGSAQADLYRAEQVAADIRRDVVSARFSQWVVDGLNRVNRNLADLRGALAARPVTRGPVVIVGH